MKPAACSSRDKAWILGRSNFTLQEREEISREMRSFVCCLGFLLVSWFARSTLLSHWQCHCFLRFLQFSSLPLFSAVSTDFLASLFLLAFAKVCAFVGFQICLVSMLFEVSLLSTGAHGWAVSLLVLLSCWNVLIPWFSQLCLVVLSVLSAGLLQLYLVFKVLKFPVQAYFTGFLASLASNISTCFLGYFRTSQVARRKI